MSERDGYEHGVPCWVETLQPDPQAARAFYSGLFGWDFAGPGPGDYFVARLRGDDVAGLATPPAGVPTAWNTHMWVDDVEAAAERAVDAGGRLVAGPMDLDPAGRMAVLADPEGATFCAWKPRERRGAQRVNEPGAWAMSQLLATDPEGAKAFYGAVFGWTSETFELGGGLTATMFRLPGYVGGEPEQPVSREVVATMTAAGPGVTQQWSPDFWVDDTDAAAARATALGGSAVAGPFDTPVGRSAVLADPGGATFSITRIGVGA